MNYLATIGERTFSVTIEAGATEHEFEVTVDGARHSVSFAAAETGWLFSLILEGRSAEVAVGQDRISVDGEEYAFEVVRDAGMGSVKKTAASHGSARLKPPIPGLVVSIQVQAGDTVELGQTVVILEAMKMQMELKAPRSGRVTEVLVQPRQEVTQTQVLLVIGD